MADRYDGMELDLVPMANMELELEALGITPSQYAALDGRVQANTDAIGALDDRVDEAEAEIGQRYTKDETDGLLAGKADLADSLTLKNLVTNGDFSQGTTGWVGLNATITVESGRLAILPNKQYRGATQPTTLLADNKYYLCATLDSPLDHYIVVNGIGLSTVFKKTDGVERLSAVVLPPTEMTTNISINSSLASDWVKFYVDGVSLINLTATFGAGNEPTKEEMDKLIDLLGGWFDGEITLAEKQLAIWTLNLIRKNTNAIIALGGTII